MRRGGDDYNLYSSSGSGSPRYTHSYGMRTKPTLYPAPKVNYQLDKLYTDREAVSRPANSTTTDIAQSSWAVRAQDRQGYTQRAPSADRASSVDRTTSMYSVQDIRPSRINLSSHRFSEPVTLIDKPVPELTFERSSYLAPRMSNVSAYSTKRTYY